MSFSPNPKEVLVNQFGEKSINYIAPGSNFGLRVSVVLTAAQVIALNASPISIIPAVSGKVLKVNALNVTYTFGSAAFTTGSTKHIILQYSGAGTTSIVSTAETGLIDQTSSKESTTANPAVTALGLRGQAIQVTSDDTTIAAGTGSTVTITAYYDIV